MPENTLNCQNLPCPQPLLCCKGHIDTHHPQSFQVIVDNEPALENVTRYLRSRGYDTTHNQTASHCWNIVATYSSQESLAASQGQMEQEKTAPLATNVSPAPTKQAIVVLLTSEILGAGDDVLGAKLMQNFLLTLPELGADLWRVICLNGAVRLSAASHMASPALRALEEAGVSILVCGTCLDHFGLLEEKAVGETTNMLDVVTSLQLATKVIQP